MNQTVPEPHTEPQADTVPPLDNLDTVVAATERRQSIASEVAARLGVAPDKACNLLRNVWHTSKGQPPLTDQEMFTGMSLIARFDLDPIAKEVYVTRDGKGRLLTIIGIDGWIKAVLRTDHYNGFEQEEGLDENGQVEWVETRIFSTKLERPTTYRARASEYGKLGGYVAKIIPIHMLKLFSFRHAARFFTPLGGVSTEEEANWMQGQGDEAKPGAPATSLDELTTELSASQVVVSEKGAMVHCKPEPAEEQSDPPEIVTREAMAEAAGGMAAATTIGQCTVVEKQFRDRGLPQHTLKAIGGLRVKRVAEIKASRGQNSNPKPKPNPEPAPEPEEIDFEQSDILRLELRQRLTDGEPVSVVEEAANKALENEQISQADFEAVLQMCMSTAAGMSPEQGNGG